MSNWSTIGQVNDGIQGTNPAVFSASTVDSLATLTAPGYLNDMGNQVKLNDKFYINYADTSVQPVGGANSNAAYLSGTFYASVVGGNMNLVQESVTTISGLAYLAANGVHTAEYVNAGGSATLVITDPKITTSSIVVGNLLSSANAVNVEKVTITANTITVLFSGDPGASVFSYWSVIPSVLLTNSGIYAASTTDAGGSATISITDAAIIANSIVKANLEASVNAVSIEKVTATSGGITILNSADAGASTISYIAITPTANLEQSGVHATRATVAGGSATVVITDPAITPSSVPVANFQTSTSAVKIDKVTPSLGALTLLCSGAPGSSTVNYMATATTV